jgi:hypothetical protein
MQNPQFNRHAHPLTRSQARCCEVQLHDGYRHMYEGEANSTYYRPAENFE